MIKFHFPNINLADTFECGQCFRWENAGDRWRGVVGGEVVEVWKDGEDLVINSDKNEEFWKEYFDYERATVDGRPYEGIVQKCYEAGKGIRILKQDPWETLVSFIISQNNNIPRIKGIIKRLCDGENPFPQPQDLIGKDLSPIRAGFRDKYILSAAEKCNGDFLEEIANLSTNELREQLMTIKGVGQKIADCVMLFAYHRLEVFPCDVWIKRIMQEQFGIAEKEIESYVSDNFGDNAGYIQQYLYHYFRNVERN